MRLEADNRPKELGWYYAGNFNTRMNRLEIKFVNYQDDDHVWVSGDKLAFIVSDFDYWSDKQD